MSGHVSAQQELALAVFSNAAAIPSTNCDTAALIEAHIMAASRACRSIVQRCLREDEWLDAEEAFSEILRQHFGRDVFYPM